MSPHTLVCLLSAPLIGGVTACVDAASASRLGDVLAACMIGGMTVYWEGQDAQARGRSVSRFVQLLSLIASILGFLFYIVPAHGWRCWRHLLAYLGLSAFFCLSYGLIAQVLTA